MGNNISYSGKNKEYDISNNPFDIEDRFKPKDIEPVTVGNNYYVEIKDDACIGSIYYLPENVKIGETYRIMNMTKNFVDLRGRNVKIDDDILPYVLRPRGSVVMVMTSRGWVSTR